MTQKSKTVVFFGSGPVAAKSLELLIAHTPIEAVVTKPRLVHHRGDIPVLETAKKLGIATYTPSNKRELSELFAQKPFSSTLGIVIDYGIIIAQEVIDYFPLSIINSHFSLLPEWRGADPISYAILSGQKKTGVSLMLISAGMDEGPIIAYGEYELSPTATTPLLTKDLIALSDGLLKFEVPRHFAGKTKPVDQLLAARTMGYSDIPSYSHKLTKEDGIIDWNKPADQLEREIRAFAEWPKSRIKMGEVDVVITASLVDTEQIGKPGEIIISGKELFVACGKDSLKIVSLKPAGKNEMPAQAFLAGYRNRLSV
jgi:methionyl-tRNA formyltransferase